MPQDELINILKRDDILIVSFQTPSIGALSGIEKIADELFSLIRIQQPKKIIIDFDRVLFLSSRMLGLLVDIWKRLKNCGGMLLVSGINPQLKRVFRITNLDKIFDFYDDADSAIKAFGAGKN